MPGWQVIWSQQPPLHIKTSTQDVLQVLCEEQVRPTGQSLGLRHPHAVPAMHAGPWGEPLQSRHCPGGPQLVLVP